MPGIKDEAYATYPPQGAPERLNGGNKIPPSSVLDEGNVEPQVPECHVQSAGVVLGRPQWAHEVARIPDDKSRPCLASRWRGRKY